MKTKITILIFGLIASFLTLTAVCSAAEINPSDIGTLRSFDGITVFDTEWDTNFAVKQIDRTIAHFDIANFPDTFASAILAIPITNFDPGQPEGAFAVYSFAGDGTVSTDEWSLGTLYQACNGLTSWEETLTVDITNLVEEARGNNDSYLSFNFRQGEGTSDRFWLAFNGGPGPAISTTVTPEPLSYLLFLTGALPLLSRSRKKRLNHPKRTPFFLAGFFVFNLLALINTQCAWADYADDNSIDIFFLHHSTGNNVYRYPDEGVPGWISGYNDEHGTNLSISDNWYPSSGNMPYHYYNEWLKDDTAHNRFNNLIQNYDVIIMKHCYPASDVNPDLSSPNPGSSYQSLENYKAFYRLLRDEFDQHQDKRFIVWTLPPLHRNATNAGDAERATEFSQWLMTDFLNEDGPHENIFTWDFRGYVTGEDDFLKYEYERSHTGTDSHPNTLANNYTGPLFAQFIADAATQPTVTPEPLSYLLFLTGALPVLRRMRKKR